MPRADFNHASDNFRQGFYQEAQRVFQELASDSERTPRMRELASFFSSICDIRRQLDTHARESASFLSPSIRVGLISPQDHSKGIYRDIETVYWALSADASFDVSICEIRSSMSKLDYSRASKRTFEFYADIEKRNSLNPGGFSEWLDSRDVVFIPETLNLSLVRMVAASATAKRIVLLPNADWTIIDPDRDDVSEFVEAAKRHQSTVTILTRTKSTLATFNRYGVESIFIPWSIPDPVLPKNRLDGSQHKKTVLFNGGNLGYRDRRGLDIVLGALSDPILQDVDFKTIIKVVKFPNSLRSRIECLHCEVELLTGFVERDRLYELYRKSDITLYPSRFEGFGMSLLEAMHAGSYPLATDGPPMNELVLGQEMCVPATRTGQMRLAETFEVEPVTLARCLKSALESDVEVSPAQSRILKDRQQLFSRQLTSIFKLIS